MAITDGLVSYYKLDESTGSTLDSHGTNHGLKAGSVAQGITGIINTAYSFSGVADFNSIVALPAFSLGSVSLTCWASSIYAPGTSRQDIVNNSEDSCSLRWEHAAGPAIIIRTAGGYTTVERAGTLTANTWHHFGATYDNDILKLYLDGSLVGSSTAPTGSIVQATSAWNLGKHPANVNYFRGRIDEVGFWNRVLTLSEIQELYNNGSGLAYPFSGAVPPAINFIIKDLIMAGLIPYPR